MKTITNKKHNLPDKIDFFLCFLMGFILYPELKPRNKLNSFIKAHSKLLQNHRKCVFSKFTQKPSW